MNEFLIYCGSGIETGFLFFYFFHKKNESSKNQLELNHSHEKALKEVGWNQKMELGDRLALKVKIVYQYVDELWKNRYVLSEKEFEGLDEYG